MKLKAIFYGGRHAPADYKSREVTIIAFLFNSEDTLTAVYVEDGRISYYDAAFFNLVEEIEK